MNDQAGVRAPLATASDRFDFLDDPEVRRKFVDYSDQDVSRVTLLIPAIHCIACVWLLENLCRLKSGIGRSEVNFLRKEVAISFQTRAIKLSEILGLLTALGYEPELKLADLDRSSRPSIDRKLWIQTGIAGFAFGNTMLLSFALYFGVDGVHGPSFEALAGAVSLLLAIPVLLYSARDYFRLAWTGFKHKLLTIEVPIVLGILAIFGQSVWQILSGSGPGYLDSFTGLIFFLLCGRIFQQKTYSRLAFDRDYKSFFPLSITRKGADREEVVSLSQIEVGDRLLIRNGELIPADSKLIEGGGLIDYSFVTGESLPVARGVSEHLYAGGRQMGAIIEIETVKPVSQSYLASLWNQEAFIKPDRHSLNDISNRYSQVFTQLILLVAFLTAGYWTFADPPLAFRSLTSILIVACPCALALAAPFTFGAAIRLAANRGIFIKAPQVLEKLARIDTIVFDKTGTLTGASGGSVRFCGAPLAPDEELRLYSLSRLSTHPFSRRIAKETSRSAPPETVRSFAELPGCGVEGCVGGHHLLLGSAEWLRDRGVAIPGEGSSQQGVQFAVDGRHRGSFEITSGLRDQVGQLVQEVGERCHLVLLSGDNDRERPRFLELFGPKSRLLFNQSPAAKLTFIRDQRTSGHTVLMVGDGLNDAGALRQSDVGISVVESMGAFSPASDIIVSADRLPRLGWLLRFSKAATAVVYISLGLSALYNLAGISIAARGLLSPVICAILMPLSSITVVAFACGATTWMARKTGLSANPLTKL